MPWHRAQPWLVWLLLVLASAYSHNGIAAIVPPQAVLLSEFVVDFDQKFSAGYVDVHFFMHAKPTPGSDDPAMMKPRNGDFVMYLMDDEEASMVLARRNHWNQNCKMFENESRKHAVIDMSAFTSEGWTFAIGITEGVRPRVWDIVVESCNGKSADLTFTIHWQNIKPVAGWQHEFGADFYGSFYCQILLFIIYTGLLLIQVTAHGRQYEDSTLIYPLAKALSISVIFGLVSAILEAVHLGVFSGNGSGLPWVRAIASFCFLASRCIVCVTLLLLSAGWGITFALIPETERIPILIVSLRFLECFFLELWADSTAPTIQTFMYNSKMGFAICVFDVMTAYVYCARLRKSAEGEFIQKHKVFYNKWGVPGVLYFFLQPLGVFSATLFSPHCRLKWVLGIINFGHAAALGTLILALFPRYKNAHLGPHSALQCSINENNLPPDGYHASLMEPFRVSVGKESISDDDDTNRNNNNSADSFGRFENYNHSSHWFAKNSQLELPEIGSKDDP
eukprot:GEMP01022071.1.p1 GENE.GEMP01022071.1~~GEMP01022071.1.p1  ORF type:complete len:507 (+),score=60.85 GEMP01022071.1:21-1541(+)